MNAFGMAVCEALGLDGDKIQRIVIDIDPDKTLVTITRSGGSLKGESGDMVVELIKNYVLEAKEYHV